MSDLNAESSEELDALKLIVNKYLKGEKSQIFFMEFFMTNIFTYLDMSKTQTLNPLFNFSSEIIKKLLDNKNGSISQKYVEILLM